MTDSVDTVSAREEIVLEDAVETMEEEAPPSRHGCMTLRNKKFSVTVESRFLLFRLPQLVGMNDNSMTLHLFSSEGTRVLSSGSASTLRTGIAMTVHGHFRARFSLPQHLLESGVRFLCHRQSLEKLQDVGAMTETPGFAHLFYATSFTLDDRLDMPPLALREQSERSWSPTSALQLQFALIYAPQHVKGVGDNNRAFNMMLFHGEHIVTLVLEARSPENADPTL